MTYMNVKIKKLCSDAKVPTYGTPNSAGADLYACTQSQDIEIQPGQTQFIHTGIALELPEGTVGLIYARSGLACKQGLAPANKVGVIDSDYRGEIIVALHNHSQVCQTIHHLDRIAQLVITPYFVVNFQEENEINQTLRGEGGFGSTGKN